MVKHILPAHMVNSSKDTNVCVCVLKVGFLVSDIRFSQLDFVLIYSDRHW